MFFLRTKSMVSRCSKINLNRLPVQDKNEQTSCMVTSKDRAEQDGSDTSGFAENKCLFFTALFFLSVA